jgi:hypothetical protein
MLSGIHSAMSSARAKPASSLGHLAVREALRVHRTGKIEPAVGKLFAQVLQAILITADADQAVARARRLPSASATQP